MVDVGLNDLSSLRGVQVDKAKIMIRLRQIHALIDLHVSSTSSNMWLAAACIDDATSLLPCGAVILHALCVVCSWHLLCRSKRQIVPLDLPLLIFVVSFFPDFFIWRIRVVGTRHYYWCVCRDYCNESELRCHEFSNRLDKVLKFFCIESNF